MPSELRDGARSLGNGEFGAVVTESPGIRMSGMAAGSVEVATDDGIDVSSRIPFRSSSAFLLTQPGCRVDGLSRVAAANHDGLKFSDSNSSGGEFGAKDLGRHFGSGEQVLANHSHGRRCPHASGQGRHGGGIINQRCLAA